MANIKSAKKRIKVSAKKTARNKSIRSTVKTEVKKVVTAVDASNADEAKSALVNAITEIDKATSKGIFHKKTAARKKSTLAKLVNQI